MIDEIVFRIVGARDPNEKVGSLGTGELQYLSGEEPLRYAIYFENIETATAPAQEVVITDFLDVSNLDLSTFSLGPITFGDKQVTPLPGRSDFTTDVDLRPQNNLIVRINVHLDKDNGLLTWRFTTINPTTGQPPEDPLAGFLPPGAEGNVLLTVMPKKGLPTGTMVLNTASIVFDVNPPMLTPMWFNTLDNTKPFSEVLPLPATESTRFRVEWAGDDEGSGVKDYSIYVSDNFGPYKPWLSNTTATSAIFEGQSGHTYAFYSIARDNTSNIEEPPSLPDAVTTAIGPANVTAQVSITRGGFRYNRSTQRYVQTVTIKNISSNAISGPVSLVLDSLSINAALFNKSGVTTRVPPLGSPYINVNVGSDGVLNPGERATIVLEFTNPTNRGITYLTRVLAGGGN